MRGHSEKAAFCEPGSVYLQNCWHPDLSLLASRAVVKPASLVFRYGSLSWLRQWGSLDFILQSRDSSQGSTAARGILEIWEGGFVCVCVCVCVRLSQQLPGAIGIYWVKAKGLDVFRFVEHSHAVKKYPTPTRHLCRWKTCLSFLGPEPIFTLHKNTEYFNII